MDHQIYSLFGRLDIPIARLVYVCIAMDDIIALADPGRIWLG